MNERVRLFDPQALRLDAPAAIQRICELLRGQVLKQLRRRGAVLGLSGGVDSSVVAALCVRALGARNVLAILMPEQDAEAESLHLGRRVAEELGIECIVEDITPILAAAGCYRRRDQCIRRIFPEYGPGYRSRIVLRKQAGGDDIPELMKQRTRKQIEYYHADRMDYAVAGTANRLEYDQGLFVKNGDGAADVKPIAHLYKSQVCQLAEYLGVPREMRSRPPTADSCPLAQAQEELYFGIPLEKLDHCLFALDNGVPALEAAALTGLEPEQVEEVYRDILAKRRATRYQHEPPLLIA
jgi:NAD+ synthase